VPGMRWKKIAHPRQSANVCPSDETLPASKCAKILPNQEYSANKLSG
jgi:hypothetical protein